MPAANPIHIHFHDQYAKPGALTPPGAEPVVRLENLEKFFG